jgi:hypothetical protein
MTAGCMHAAHRRERALRALPARFSQLLAAAFNR